MIDKRCKNRIQHRTTSSKYDVFKTKGGYLNERQKEIKEYLIKNQPLKISDIAKKFDKININTIKKDLQYMKREKVIKTVGKGKGTVYIWMKITNAQHCIFTMAGKVLN